MESKPLPLKLAAILYADVAEYSRLTGEDEQGTHRRLSEYLDLISKDVGRHNGRVVHYAGDAVLAYFSTVADALICAASVQRQLSLRNEDTPDERKVQFRIGVNLGDVIEDRGDIYGEGVNVAARLESLAEPGGICISESVHTAVGHKLPFDYEYMGEQEVKNIAKPIKAYRANLQSDAELPTPSKARRPGKQTPRYLAIAAVIVLVIGAGVLGWIKPWEPREEPASMDQMAFPLPDKPSIAVLPFTNLSGDSEQDYFTDGMTEDLITDLSKVSGLFVIARNSTFTYKGKPVKVRQVAEELGVRYVLEGSMRRSNGQIRINAQLIDAVSGGHVWAERYDSSLTDIFALQDKVTQNIVAALAVNLTATEKARRERKETDNPEAYDALLRGRARYELKSPEDLAKAITHLERALELDPNYSRAHGLLAATYYHAWSGYDTEILGLTMDQADQKVRGHLKEAMKNPTPLAHAITSKLLNGDLRFDEAVVEAKRAIALDPSDASGYTALARVAVKANRPADGLAAIEMAMRINPKGNENGQYLWRVGDAQYLLGQYNEAADTMLEYIELSGDVMWGNFILGAAYGQLGREQEGKAAVDKFNELWVKKGRRPFTLAHLDGWALDPGNRELHKEGLRKAGMLPGGSTSPVLAGVHTAPLEVEGATTITAMEAKSLFDARVPFVDVRGKDNDWKAGHIPESVHLHLYHDFSEANLAKVVGKDEAVVIYASGIGNSQSGRASARAAIWGFNKVSYFREGFPAWKDAGYPVEIPSK